MSVWRQLGSSCGREGVSQHQGSDEEFLVAGAIVARLCHYQQVSVAPSKAGLKAQGHQGWIPRYL